MNMSIEYTPEQIWKKITWYCQYQERCHTEVLQKLKLIGVWQKEQDAILCKLIQENYINEERFAMQYAGGKFRMKQWGKVKIKYGLLQKGVSVYNIQKALLSISDDDYEETILKLAQKKWKLQKGAVHIRKRNCYSYLQQCGYENQHILNVLGVIEATK